MTHMDTFLTTPDEKRRFYGWVLNSIHPFLKGRVFETHSGTGDLSSRLVDSGIVVQLNASSESERENLRDKFKNEPLVRGIHKMTFLTEQIEEQYSHFEGQFPTVLVNSSIQDRPIDLATISKSKRLVSKGGRLIILSQCPTIPFPGTELDISILKKYNHSYIAGLLTNFLLLNIWFFNFDIPCLLTVAKKQSSENQL